jgi:hypothetical protein
MVRPPVGGAVGFRVGFNLDSLADRFFAPQQLGSFCDFGSIQLILVESNFTAYKAPRLGFDGVTKTTA